MLLLLTVILNLAMVFACEETTACPHRNKTPKPPAKDCVKSPADIALIIDSTTSINYESNFTLGLQFIIDFLDRFDISPTSTRVAAVMFGSGVYTDSAFNFDTYTTKNETLDAISKMKWKKGLKTDTNEGIKYMVNKFLPRMRKGNNVARMGIVLTDGQSHNKNKTAQAAADARSRGLTMIAIGVGEPVRNLKHQENGKLDLDELERIAGNKDFVLTVGDYFKLRSITNKLMDKFCRGVAQNANPRPANQ